MTAERKLSPTDKRKLFRHLLNRKTLTVMPGGFSPVYARIAELSGFESFFVAGSQVSAFLLGVPDNGIMGLRDIVDHVRHVTAATNIPVFVDTDTGFGNAVNVHYTVQECVNAGIAGIQIEDQEAPKKSSTSAGRRCISMEEAVGKYRAAVAAKNEIDPEFVICARCDTLGAENGGFEETVKRCIAYVQDGGADFVWLNSIESREQVKEACARIPAPVLTIWGGPEPAPTPEEYEKLGLRIVLYPVIAATAGMQAAWQLFNDLKQRGKPALDDWAAGVRASKFGAVQLKTVVNSGKVREIEDAFLPESEKRDYEGTWGHATPLGEKNL